MALALAAFSVLLAACDDHSTGAASHVDGPPARAIEGAKTLGSGGDRPGKYFTPRGVVSDGDTLWVVDRTARVQQIDPANGDCLQWFKMPEWELGKPTGLAIGPAPGERPGQQALYIADTHYHRIVIYALPETPRRAAPGSGPAAGKQITPTLLAKLGDYGEKPGQFVYPCSVAILPTADGLGVDRIYVGEFGGNDRVQIFDRSLACIGSFGTIGDGTNPDPTRIELSRPQSMAIHPARKSLFVADSINHRLGEFTFDGVLKRWIGAEGSGPGQFRHPRSIIVAPDLSLLVVEFGNNRVQRIDVESGRSLGVWGKAGGRVGELAEPWSVALVRGRAYVAEARNNRITSFVPN